MRNLYKIGNVSKISYSFATPYHDFEKWRSISFFYDGLTPKTKKLVETICHGEFIDKNEDEAK